MTLNELLAADKKTKEEFGLKIYTNLVKLYVDQYGEGAYTVEVVPEKTN